MKEQGWLIGNEERNKDGCGVIEESNMSKVLIPSLNEAVKRTQFQIRIQEAEEKWKTNPFWVLCVFGVFRHTPVKRSQSAECGRTQF